MTFVITAVIGAAVGLATGASLTMVAIGFVASIVLGALSQALTKKPKAPQLGSFSIDAKDRTIMVRQPITERTLEYGRVRVSGALFFVETTDSDKNLHLCITLAGHEVEEIGDIWLDDDVIRPDMLDGSGEVTSGRYLKGGTSHVRIKKHLGTAAQVADADLVAEAPNWTTAHRARGVAYIYIRLKFNRDLFPTSIPNVSAVIKGKKVYDDRTAVTVWSPNPALIIRDYMTDATLGLNVAAAKIDYASFNAAANTCEEQVAVVEKSDDFTADASNDELTRATGNARWVIGDVVQVSTTDTLPAPLAAATDYYVVPTHETVFKLATTYATALAGTVIDITDAGVGTHTAARKSEARYTCNGTVFTSERPMDIIQGLNTALMGKAVSVGGAWKLYAGAYVTPTITLDEDDLRGPINVKTLVSRREALNSVKGLYVSPDNSWQPSDFPPVKNATYFAADGSERIWKDVELPYTTSAATAQRIAKIELERSRQEITVTLPCKLTAYTVEPPEVVNLDNDRMGWAAKPFEVTSARLVSYRDQDGAPMVGVDLNLRETASAVYDWASGEETTVDPAPNTNLPDPFTVPVPTGFAVTTDTFFTDNNTQIDRIKLSWTAMTDAAVLAHGRIEVQFKLSSAADWEPSFFVDGEEVQAFIAPVQQDTNYDLRVRAINNLGVRSNWSSIFGYTVGAAGAGATNQKDYRFIVEPEIVINDRGAVAETSSTQLDYGSIA